MGCGGGKTRLKEHSSESEPYSSNAREGRLGDVEQLFSRQGDPKASSSSCATVGFMEAEGVGPVRLSTVGFLEAEGVGAVKVTKIGRAASDTCSGTSEPNSPTKAETRRQMKMKERKLKLGGKKFSENFLSSVPDVGSDVQYRFKLILVGDFAENVAERVCSSAEAAKYASGGNCESEEMSWEYGSRSGSPHRFSPDPSSGCATPDTVTHLETNSSSSGAASGTASGNASEYGKGKQWAAHSYRCVCPVPYPVRAVDRDSAKYCKLSFEPLSFSGSVPGCKTAQEAASTALVFCIMIGNEGNEEENALRLQAQLDNLLNVLQKRRQRKKRLRPAWAVILCHPQDVHDSLTEGSEPWALALEDFEKTHGALWRFGAMGWQDGDKLYGAIAKIASHRIYSNQNPGLFGSFASEVAENRPPLERMRSSQKLDAESSGSDSASVPMWEAEGMESASLT